MESIYKAVGKSIVGSVSIAFTMFFARIIGITIVWLGAKILQWIFGAYLVAGLNDLFGTTRFNVGQIPAMLVIAYLFGSYLITTTTVKSEPQKK